MKVYQIKVSLDEIQPSYMVTVFSEGHYHIAGPLQDSANCYGVNEFPFAPPKNRLLVRN